MSSISQCTQKFEENPWLYVSAIGAAAVITKGCYEMLHASTLSRKVKGAVGSCFGLGAGLWAISTSIDSMNQRCIPEILKKFASEYMSSSTRSARALAATIFKADLFETHTLQHTMALKYRLSGSLCIPLLVTGGIAVARAWRGPVRAREVKLNKLSRSRMCRLTSLAISTMVTGGGALYAMVGSGVISIDPASEPREYPTLYKVGLTMTVVGGTALVASVFSIFKSLQPRAKQA